MPNPLETSIPPSAFVRTGAQGKPEVSPQAFTSKQSTAIQLPSLSDIKALTQAPATTSLQARQSTPDPISNPDHFRIFQRGVSYVYCVYNEGSANDIEVLSSDKSKLRDGDSFIDNLGVKSMQEYIKCNPEFLHEGDKVSFGVREQQGIIPIYWGQIPKISDQEQITKHGLKKPTKHKSAMSHRLLEDANSRAMQSFENQIQDLRRELSDSRAKLGEKEGNISTLQAEKNTLTVENSRLKDYEQRYTEARNETLEWQKKFDEKDRSCRNEIIEAISKRDDEHKERFDIAQQALTSQINDLKDQITQLQRELNTERQNHEFTKEKVNRGDSREVQDLRDKLTQVQIDMRLTVNECNNKLAQMEQQQKAREQELTYYYNQKIQEARSEAEEEVLDKHKHTLGDATRNEMALEQKQQLLDVYERELEQEQEKNAGLKRQLRKLQLQIDHIEAERKAKPSATEMVMTTLKDYAPLIAQAGFALASGKDPSAIAGMLAQAPQAPPVQLADEDYAEINVAPSEAPSSVVSSSETTSSEARIEPSEYKRKKKRRGSRGGRNRYRRTAYNEADDEEYDDDRDDDDQEYDDPESDDQEYDNDDDQTASRQSDSHHSDSRQSGSRLPERPEMRQEYRHKRSFSTVPPPPNSFTTPRLDPTISQPRPLLETTRQQRYNDDSSAQDSPPQAFRATQHQQSSAFLHSRSSSEPSGMIPELRSAEDFANALNQQQVFDEE